MSLPVVDHLQAVLDLSKKSRDILAELTGAVAISSSVAAIALAGGLHGPSGEVTAGRRVRLMKPFRSRASNSHWRPHSAKIFANRYTE